jgi:fructose-bisphosphate aldolase class I
MLTIEETIATILSPAKGMLVADEYAEALVVAGGDTNGVTRFAESLGSTPGLADHVSSVLLTWDTFDAVAPALPTRPLVGVRLTTRSDAPGGFTDLVRTRASFVEWRAHLSPLDVPRGAVHIEAATLARGAAAAQAECLLPVLTVAMPDLGPTSVGVTQAVTTNALRSLRNELDSADVDPSRLLLRVNMIVAGVAHPEPTEPEQAAELTVEVLERCLPTGIGGVLLLSGGQPLDRACANLRAVSALAALRAVPWRVTFGFSRSLVSAAAGVFDDPANAGRLLVESARLAGESLGPVLVG